jgi:hypothetical protein
MVSIMEPRETPSATAFTVLQFSLEQDAQGKANQKVVPCGRFASIEAAFAVARLNAAKSFAELSAKSIRETGRPGRVTMTDTEWGYDVKVEHLTVLRFWVHDSQPAALETV